MAHISQTVSLDEELVRTVRELAEREHRNLSNQFETLVRKGLDSLTKPRSRKARSKAAVSA